MNIQLTPLQQELFNELIEDLADMPDEIYEKESTELAASIKTLNACELRHNIKTFQDVRNSYIMQSA